jgi:DNA repair exonuclease SbcCD nuclease subunit
MGFLPYYSNPEEFVDAANKLASYGIQTLFCHQTFQGSQFENGFYAPEGIDQNLVQVPYIVSGHIHKNQRLGKVLYPGTPKWDTLSDANETKGIWVLSETLALMVDSSTVIDPIISMTVTPETDLGPIKLGPKTYLELEGPSQWIASVSKKLKGQCKITARPTDRETKRSHLKTVKSIFEYLDGYEDITLKDDVRDYLKGMSHDA